MSKLFFIGTGKMATAIAGGVVRAGVLNSSEIAGFDVNSAAAETFKSVSGADAFCAGLEKQLETAEYILIAVKPQMLADALTGFREILKEKTVLSIAAGVTIEKLEALTGSKRIVRIMPNTPALVGAGAAAYALSAGVTAEDAEFAERIFSAVGTAVKVPESALDAVTALSGSGPAYVFEFIQALADGGVAEGLPRDIALQLAVQTVAGSAKMVAETGTHPAQLKDNVTSPGGTTSRALEFMAAKGFAGIVMQSVRAAAKRSRELGGK